MLLSYSLRVLLLFEFEFVKYEILDTDLEIDDISSNSGKASSIAFCEVSCLLNIYESVLRSRLLNLLVSSLDL